MRFAFLALVLVGCGGSSAMTTARSTLALSQRVVTELDARPPPTSPALQSSVARARALLADAESSLDSWAAEDSGDLAWRTIAPCLGAALTHAADALRALHAPDDRDLEEAIAKLHAESVDECHEPEPAESAQ